MVEHHVFCDVCLVFGFSYGAVAYCLCKLVGKIVDYCAKLLRKTN